MKTRVCEECGEEYKRQNSNRQIYCTKKCYSVAKRRINSFSQREYDLKRNYGIDEKEYNRLFIKQNGCCAICNKHQELFKKRLHVDHDHKTGKIRGLLCHNCNLALGRFFDDEFILLSAIRYLA